MISNYIKQNSYIHRINPIIKFIAFTLTVILLFLNSSFVIQGMVFIIIFPILIIAKLPKYIYKKLFITFIFLIIVIFVINWVVKKSPGFYTQEMLNNYRPLFGKALTIPIITNGAENSNVTIADATLTTSSPPTFAQSGTGYGIYLVADEAHQKLNQAQIFESKEQIISVLGASSSAKNGAIIASETVTQKIFDPSKYGFTNYNLQLVQLGRGKFVGFFAKSYAITSFMALLALNVGIKLILVIVCSTLLLTTTNTIEITFVFSNFTQIFKFSRFSANEIAMMFSISLRFIPSLIQESFRIIKSQASRGIDFKNGNIKDKMISIISLVVPLFTIAFIKADDLANAISIKGYDPKSKRTLYRFYDIKIWNLIGFIVFIAMITVLFFYYSHSLYLPILGTSDILVYFGK